MTGTTSARRAARPESHREIMVVIGALMLALLLAALDSSIVGTALPTIVGDLHGMNELSWVVTAYLLTATASTPLYGKLGDLFGRKRIFQAAIGIFLIGSVLAGASQSMWQLIVTRGVQGLGGGGLMSLAFAIVGDLVPPADRGRYQGYFGAVFGVSSVAGPLAGGLFVQHLSWRWIFYINVPLGIAALVATGIALHTPQTRRQHRIDWAGAAVMVTAVCSLLLALVSGGTRGWTAPLVLAEFAAAAVLAAGFVAIELRAAEPILPLRLFRSSIVSVSTVLGFVVGAAMFGCIVYLPVFLQLGRGQSATMSGLSMLPLVLGILLASTWSGRQVSRRGSYRVFPIVGLAVMTVGALLFTRLTPGTPVEVMFAYMFTFGIGMGLVMQVLVLAAQNAVAQSDLGVVSASSSFFRSLGSTVGTAVFGTVLTSVLTSHLVARLAHLHTGQLPGGSAALTSSPAAVHALPGPVRDAVVSSYTSGLHAVFVLAAAVLAAAFVLSFALKDTPLRGAEPATQLS